MIWVYGICERPDVPPPRGRGLAGASLDGVREGDLLAVISRHVDRAADPALDALYAHERVIERIMADRAVLPMRFGSELADDDALRDVLVARQGELLAALERVRGRVEVGIRAIRPNGGQPGADRVAEPRARAAMSGREYLERKLEDGRRIERDAAAVHEPLARLAVAISRLPPRAPHELLRASYLVDTPAVPRFRDAVGSLQRTTPGVAILCTGPWPPYSFVATAATAPAAKGAP
jgi:hypothetical protein